MIYIILPIHNAERFIGSFLDSLANQTFKQYKLVIVNDGSSDRSLEVIKEKSNVTKVIHGDGSWWWTRSVNEGVNYVLSLEDVKWVLLLNVDLELAPDYLEKLFEQTQTHPNVMIGSAIHNIESGQVVDLGWKVNPFTTLAVNNTSWYHPGMEPLISVQHLSGRGMMIPSSAFDILGLFDDKNFPQYSADEVFSILARKKGYKLYFLASAKIYSYVEETGLVKFAKVGGWKGFIRYLTHFSSPGNLKIRAKTIAFSHPVYIIPSFWFIDTIKIMLRYWIWVFKYQKI